MSETFLMAEEFFRKSRTRTVNVVELLLPIGLDIDEFDRLNTSLLAAVSAEPAGQWVLDLSKLDYMGSASLGLMVNVRQIIKGARGRLVLCGLSPRLVHVFRTCCLERLFKIMRLRDEAIEAAEW